ncbi:MAG TPA: PHP domain-containing protein [Candidatus Paceibacterota bacterium]
MIQNSQNLHTHTWLSDGKMTHRETLDVALANGCSVVAFTDHDVLPNDETLAELESLRAHACKWVMGIEISTTDPHMIGLFVDPRNGALIEHTRVMKDTRIKKTENVASNLAKLGFEITAKEIIDLAGEGSVGKPHVVEVLMSKSKNVALLRTFIKKMEEAAKTDTDLARDYTEALEGSQRAGLGRFVYPIFLRKNSFAAGVYEDYDASPSIEQAATLIRNAGGVAVIAHWHTSKKTLPLEKLEQLLRDKVIDGVETVWGLSAYGTSGEDEMRADRRAVTEIVERTGALGTPSLDAHKREDYELFGRQTFFAKETVGMVEKLIATSGVSTKFSSL